MTARPKLIHLGRPDLPAPRFYGPEDWPCDVCGKPACVSYGWSEDDLMRFTRRCSDHASEAFAALMHAREERP